MLHKGGEEEEEEEEEFWKDLVRGETTRIAKTGKQE